MARLRHEAVATVTMGEMKLPTMDLAEQIGKAAIANRVDDETVPISVPDLLVDQMVMLHAILVELRKLNADCDPGILVEPDPIDETD